MRKKFCRMRPMLLVPIFRMKSVGPTTRMKSSSNSASIIVASDMRLKPRCRPRNALVPYTAMQPTTTATSSMKRRSSPKSSATAAEIIGVESPSDVPVPPMRLIMYRKSSMRARPLGHALRQERAAGGAEPEVRNLAYVVRVCDRDGRQAEDRPARDSPVEHAIGCRPLDRLGAAGREPERRRHDVIAPLDDGPVQQALRRRRRRRSSRAS